jgi:hypothetical protein
VERSLLALLSRLIGDYENSTFPVPSSHLHQTLQFLMQQNDLRLADLCVDIWIASTGGLASKVIPTQLPGSLALGRRRSGRS